MSSLNSSSGYHHGDLRNALLEAGEQLLLKRGVAALSLREVAKLAGVSHAAPYRHFRDKAALMRALAQSGFGRLQSDIRAAAEKVPHDPEQKLAAAGVAYVHLAVRNPELIQLMFGAGIDRPEDKDLEQAFMGAFESLVDIINTGIETGVFRDRDARELALVAWTSMHGMAMLLAARLMGINVEDDKALDRMVRSVAQNVIYGISR
jgi:AcrR family transcriptional regulator